MNYATFKLNFRTAVHFGDGGVLDSAGTSFLADTLFSALYIESLKLNLNDQLLSYVKEGKLVFSDAFPFKDNQYFLPKPMKQVEGRDAGNSTEKKLLKKIKYIPCDMIDRFLKSEADLKELSKFSFYKLSEDTKVSIRNEKNSESDGEPKPYRVGVCTFNDNCGLYVVVGYENDDIFGFIKSVFESLQYTGIGGKRASGLGRFELSIDKNSQYLQRLLNRQSDTYMTISVSYPQDDELDNALEQASYNIVKRSGFVLSDTYAQEHRRKLNKFLFASGSCFKNKFTGTILDVSANSGTHPVYRYAFPMFIGV